MYCPKCGKQLQDGSRFCTKCGHKIEIAVEETIIEPSIEDNDIHEEELSNAEVVEEYREEFKDEEIYNEEAINIDDNNTETDEVNESNNKKGEKDSKEPFVWQDKYTYLLIGVAIIIAALVGFAIKFNAPDQIASLFKRNTVEKASTESAYVEATSAVEHQEHEESTSVVSEEEKTWKDAMSGYLQSHYSDEKVIFFDLDRDNKLEAAVVNGNKYDLLTIDGNNIVDVITVRDCLVSYLESSNKLCVSCVDEGNIRDDAYLIEDGRWWLLDTAKCNVGYDELLAEPIFNYYINDVVSDAKEYYEWLSDNYEGGQNIEENGYATVQEAKELLNDKGKQDRFWDYAYLHKNRIENRWDYGCDNRIQIFIPPVAGTYDFDLIGAAGGADGQRVIDGTVYYDATGAELVGSMNLGISEKIVLIVGGAGGVSRIKAGVVEGGFNGGGDTYWSGGGGGCTDIYTIYGYRAASAAGAGGGNYDGYGEPGRISSSNREGATDGKLGGGTGYTMRDDAGAGGGAGWYGGLAGRNDGIGRGGISGYNDSLFHMYYENGGHTGVKNNEIDGHISIQRVE